MNILFTFFKMAIKIAESDLKRRVGRVSGNTGIFSLFFFFSALVQELTFEYKNCMK